MSDFYSECVDINKIFPELSKEGSSDEESNEPLRGCIEVIDYFSDDGQEDIDE